MTLKRNRAGARVSSAPFLQIVLAVLCVAGLSTAQGEAPDELPHVPEPVAQPVQDGQPTSFDIQPLEDGQVAGEEADTESENEEPVEPSDPPPAAITDDAHGEEATEGEAPVLAPAELTWAEKFQLAIDEKNVDAFYLEQLQPTMRAEAAILRAGVGDINLFFRPRKALRDDAEKLEAAYLDLVDLYGIRLDALPLLSKPMFKRFHGVGAVGRQQLVEELGFIVLGAQYDVFRIANRREDLVVQAIERDPSHVLGQIIEVLIAVLAFRWWRGWIPARIESGMVFFLKRRPRQRKNLRIAGALWYFQQVRRPLERLLMYGAIFAALDDALPGFIKLLWPIAKWILLARFVVQLINAAVKRGGVGMRRDSTGIRLRSLRLLAVWIVTIGLGLALAQTLAGQAALYAWVTNLGKVITVPVFLLLLVWWRPEIAYRLEHQRPRTAFSDGLLARRKGLESYGATIVGGVYLFGQGLKRWMLRRLTGFEEGRRALATFTHIEAVRLQDRMGDFENTTSIGKPLGKKLVDAEVPAVDAYARTLLDRMVKVVSERRNSAAAVIGERGMGKSFFLQRLAQEVEGDSLIVSCPPGGFEALLAELASKLELPSPDIDAIRAAIAERDLAFIAIDNAHLLVRPHAGGSIDLERMGQLQADTASKTPWVYTLEGTTWQFLQRARAKTTVEDEVHVLPAWSEEQIAAIIRAKCASLGIEPDYTRLVLPSRFDEVTQADTAERNRLGMARALWTAAEGNPEVASRLFVRSLVFDEHQRLLVRLFNRLDAKELQRLHLSAKLVLRYLAMSELATAEEIERGLRLGIHTIEGSLVLCEARGYIESKNGRFRITWKWFRTITQSLSRQNLLARSRTKIAQ